MPLLATPMAVALLFLFGFHTLVGRVQQQNLLPPPLLAALTTAGYLGALLAASQFYKAAVSVAMKHILHTGEYQFIPWRILRETWSYVPRLLSTQMRSLASGGWKGLALDCLWPVILITENLSGTAALERSRALVKPLWPAALGLVFRQLGSALPGILLFPVMMTFFGVPWPEIWKKFTTERVFGQVFSLYAVFLTMMIFMRYGLPFPLLYARAKCCAGEQVRLSTRFGPL